MSRQELRLSLPIGSYENTGFVAFSDEDGLIEVVFSSSSQLFNIMIPIRTKTKPEILKILFFIVFFYANIHKSKYITRSTLIKSCKIGELIFLKLRISLKIKQINSGFHYSFTAETPGNSFPSMNSSIAPPPVET